MTVFTHPEFDNHEHLSFFCDPETGLRAIVALRLAVAVCFPMPPMRKH